MAKWVIDSAHSNADFSVRHMMVSTVRGTFDRLGGEIDFDPANPSAGSVVAHIETASVNTGVADRDNHLRSGDFFESEKFPHMTFTSTQVEVTGEKQGKIIGELTIRDVTKPVVLDVEYFGQIASPFGDQRVGFSASTSINREDFGLTWNQALEAGGLLVSKDVKIMLEIQAAHRA
jgi:polyisoprenoid-binding protein YceI